MKNFKLLVFALVFFGCVAVPKKTKNDIKEGVFKDIQKLEKDNSKAESLVLNLSKK